MVFLAQKAPMRNFEDINNEWEFQSCNFHWCKSLEISGSKKSSTVNKARIL